MKHDIAVIIPLYNGERWICETLQSVMAQTCRPREVIVVDDHSTDGGASLAESVNGVRLITNATKGGGPARDLGLRHTTSPLVTFLDQDDVWAPNHLESLATILAQRPSALLAASACLPFTGDTPALSMRQMHFPPRRLRMWEHFPFGLIETPSMVLARRETFAFTGGWSDQTPLVADLELWLHAELHGEVWSSDEPTANRRVHSKSYSSVLRTAQIHKYLSALQRCATRLLSLREAAHPVDERLRHRAELPARLEAMTSALASGNIQSLFDLTAEYEKALSRESPPFKQAALTNLIWFLDPLAQSSHRCRETWWRLATALRKAGSELASRLEDAIDQWPLRTHLQLAARAPWEKARWQHVLSGIATLTAAPEQRVQLSGIDADGWAAQRCTIYHPPQGKEPCSTLRIRLELPYWLPSGEPMLTVQHEESGTIAQQAIRNGTYDVLVRNTTPHRPVSVSLQCDTAFPLPEDGRERAFRIVNIQPVSDRKKNLVLVRRVSKRDLQGWVAGKTDH